MAAINVRRAEAAAIGGVAPTRFSAAMEERARAEAESRKGQLRLKLSKTDLLALTPPDEVASLGEAKGKAFARAHKVRSAKLSSKAIKSVGKGIPARQKVVLEVIIDTSTKSMGSSGASASACASASASASASAHSSSEPAKQRAITPASTIAVPLDQAWTIGKCVDVIAAASKVTNRNVSAASQDMLRLVPLSIRPSVPGSKALLPSGTLDGAIAASQLCNMGLVALVRADQDTEWSLELGK
jgi:hypothetical protein